MEEKAMTATVVAIRGKNLGITQLSLGASALLAARETTWLRGDTTKTIQLEKSPNKLVRLRA